jgi:hypothetical protein
VWVEGSQRDTSLRRIFNNPRFAFAATYITTTSHHSTHDTTIKYHNLEIETTHTL